MAPPVPSVHPDPLKAVDGQLQKLIQTLYELLVRVAGFEGPESTEIVANTIKDLVDQFEILDYSVDPSSNQQQQNRSHGIAANHLNYTPAFLSNLPSVPREIIQYVEDGRNPDIYTREFVEIVAKQNKFLKSKILAFRRFRDVLATEIKCAFPELEKDVAKVVVSTGGNVDVGAGEKSRSEENVMEIGSVNGMRF